MSGPSGVPILDGVRVLELGGMGPGPHAAMMLADLGADVVRVERPGGNTENLPPDADFVLRNRRSVGADLKTAEGRDLVLDLAGRADVLLDGYRPGVAERLGIGPEACTQQSPRLIYARMTGWGQDGPLARTAGHDINYLALTGALHMLGREGERPHAPMNLVGDLGGGSMFAVVGVLGALYERERSGRGQVIDAAIVDGVSTLMAMYWTLTEHGSWSSERGTNMSDGAAPFYDTYRCADGRYVAIGAVEPKFYGELLRGLGLDASAMPEQQDRASWPAVRRRFEAIIARRTRDEWAAAFQGLDACVSPVLALDEVADHEHLRARGTIRSAGGQRLPAPAPRFSRSGSPDVTPPPVPGSGNAEVLADWGVRTAAGAAGR